MKKKMKPDEAFIGKTNSLKFGVFNNNRILKYSHSLNLITLGQNIKHMSRFLKYLTTRFNSKINMIFDTFILI